MTGFRAYLEELTGCSCSLRPKSVGGYPPKKEGPGPGRRGGRGHAGALPRKLRIDGHSAGVLMSI